MARETGAPGNWENQQAPWGTAARALLGEKGVADMVSEGGGVNAVPVG